MLAQICVLSLEALEPAFALLPAQLHVYASGCCWTWEQVSLQVFARCFLIPGKYLLGFTSSGKWVTWGLCQREECTNGNHRWFLSLLWVSRVSLFHVVSFLDNFILETIIEGREEGEKKRIQLSNCMAQLKWHSYTEISLGKIAYFRYQSSSQGV